MPPIANHGRALPSSATWRTRSSPGAGRPGFVGVGQQGPAPSSRHRARRPPPSDSPGVRRAADQHVGAQDGPGHRDRQVVLPEVEHVGPLPRTPRPPGRSPRAARRGARPARPIIERGELVAGLHALLAQLHDVDAAGQHRVEELAPGRPAPTGSRCTGRAGHRRGERPAARTTPPRHPTSPCRTRSRPAVRPTGRRTIKVSPGVAAGAAERASRCLADRTNLIRLAPAEGAT